MGQMPGQCPCLRQTLSAGFSDDFATAGFGFDVSAEGADADDAADGDGGDGDGAGSELRDRAIA
ncbi:hypothetical protein [Rhodobacter sp. NSM]|uniref:hypothetical protein n=1 Tax=Rhodobacter sp. NSM TaxID=3457501 RepID=UPI003FD553AE